MKDGQPEGAFWSIDDCVRAVTAFESFEDLKNTREDYAPTFYPGKGYSPAEILAMKRVANAFNAWAARVGRKRRSEVRVIQAAGEPKRGPYNPEFLGAQPPKAGEDY